MQNNDWKDENFIDAFEGYFSFLSEEDLLEEYVKCLEASMVYAFSVVKRRLPTDSKLLPNYPENILNLYNLYFRTLIRIVHQDKDDNGEFRGINILDIHEEEYFPLSATDVKDFEIFFELFKPNLLLLNIFDQVSLDIRESHFPIIVGYFSLFEILGKTPGFNVSRFHPEELTYSFDTPELKEAWKNKWKNPNFSTANFQNVSKEVQNMLLKDDKIEQLFTNIYSELNYKKKNLELDDRLLPKLLPGLHKNLFPVVKVRVEKNLPYMNYLYLEEEGKQPEEVKEVKKEEINVEFLLEKGQKPKLEDRKYTLTAFYLILLDIMFSQVLQELFKEYEFYHKKIVTMASAIIEGDVKALEENPNAQMKAFGKVGLVLYKLYFYTGIYKSIIGFNDFYFKGVNLPVFVLTLYWRLIKVMGDFALKVEGQQGCTIDTKDFPKNGKLKATIKRRNGKKHTVFWDLNKTQSSLDEKVFKLAETLNNEEKSDS